MENNGTPNEIAQLKAEREHWQYQCDDLRVANERLREERDKARATAILLEEELTKQIEQVRELRAQVDRLRIHIQQGIEL